jgi:diguanylate cyclase (GGDEF)-like protein
MDQNKILIVDDSDINRFVIESMLTDYEVFSAAAPSEMYEILKTQSVDLILLDIVMPEKSGLEVAQELGDSGKYSDIPIIFVSAKDSGEDILKGFNTGAFDYVTKPIDERILRARIESVLKHAKKEKVLEDQSLTDPLTNIYNRRFFMTRYEQECDLVIRQNRNLSVTIMDIDHFSEINEEYGRDVGDFILKETARILTNNLRLSDILARYHGPSFITLFTGYSKEESFLACMRIRGIINKHIFKLGDLQLRITMTYGIADIADMGSGFSQETYDQLVKLAEDRMYHGKKSGRNMVSIHSE